MVVLIATVSVLAGAMGLAASRPRTAGSVAVCQNNLRRLMTAWLLYAEDNRGRVARNFNMPWAERAETNTARLTWAPGTMDWDVRPSNTNQQLADLSCLAPYTTRLNGEAMPFRCPSNRFLSPGQRALGWSHRNRSYAMNGFVGSWELEGGSILSGEESYYSKQYRQFLRLDSFPQPARIFVLLEEHPDTINDGFFINPPPQTWVNSWEDIPASYHDGGVNVASADGHVERHQWGSVRSTIRAVRYEVGVPASFDAAGRKDYEWLMGQAAVRMDGTSP